jgi:dipeptidyl aminopeptidase/acylaminoacyl peptidase
MACIINRQFLSGICATARMSLAMPTLLSLIVLGSLLWESSAGGQTLESIAREKNDNFARIPGATLLIGYTEEYLWLTSVENTIRTKGNVYRAGSWLPSISADGRILAAIQMTGDYRTPPIPVTLDTQKEGEEGVPYAELKFDRGEISISPDGSKLACSRHNGFAAWNLQILDLRTGQISLGPVTRDDPGREISWSPDSRRIAFEMHPAEGSEISALNNIYAVYLLDLDSRAITQIGIGHSPSWSPSGEWIAFVGYVPRKKKDQPTWCVAGKCYEPGTDAVSVMKADGNEARTLMTFSSYIYGVAPVWSPDSKTLLINKSRNAEIDSFDIYLLDLATGKPTRIFKNTMPVYAWVKSKP